MLFCHAQFENGCSEVINVRIKKCSNVKICLENEMSVIIQIDHNHKSSSRTYKFHEKKNSIIGPFKYAIIDSYSGY